MAPEEALYYNWETKRLATNAGLIDRVVQLARAAGGEIATSEQTRQIIGVPAEAPRGRGVAA